jgi:hypothetical protein
MKKFFSTFWELALIVAVIIILVMSFLTLIGCALDPPIRNETENKKCFQFRQCMYWIQKSEDKSPCMKLLDECGKLETFEYCKNTENQISIKIKDRRGNIHEGTDFHSGCWDILK